MAVGMNCAKLLLREDPCLNSALKRLFLLGSTHVRWKNRFTVGVKKADGEFVVTGNILANQKTLKYHPGMNVEITPKLTLMALQTGHVMITTEKFNPNWSNVQTDKHYGKRKESELGYKIYFHVIPLPQKQTFKLIKQV